jgi:SAM-dependent methyltransferase
MYTNLASWFHLLTPPSDYTEEAKFYGDTIIANCHYPPHTLLELGSGGGNNASYLKTRFQLTLVDISPDMLAISQTLNPECEHLTGDMRTIRLNRLFDAVFIHDAISYMTTETDLRSAIQTAYTHCKPGGVALFAPDYTRETFKPSTNHGGNDIESRGMRYLEWVWDPDPNDTSYVVDFAYLLRDEKGNIQAEHDHHVLGIFSRETWLHIIAEEGFEPKVVSYPQPDDDSYCNEVFVGIKPFEGQ